MKTAALRKLFGTVLLCAVLLMLSGCLLFASGKSYETINYNGKDYTACGNTILLDYRLPGTSTLEDLQKTLLTKIGETKGSAVYAIKGYDSGSWLYCRFEAMLGTGPDGVYHASDIKMDNIEDFKPDGLSVYALTKPTASGSGTDSLYGGTADRTVVDTVLKAIAGGKALSPDALREAREKGWSYDNAEQYRLEFKSSAYPNLLYLCDYNVGTDGKCYVLSGQSGYELDADLLDLVR